MRNSQYNLTNNDRITHSVHKLMFLKNEKITEEINYTTKDTPIYSWGDGQEG